MTTHTATSAYRTIEVHIAPSGIVQAANGALLGDVDGMERLGWEFTPLAVFAEHSTAVMSDQDTATLFDEAPDMLEAFGAEPSLFTGQSPR